MAVDQEFLFNPILPEGMPSPPAALPPGIGFSEFERHSRIVGESLGRSVGGLQLDSNGGGNPRLDGRERRRGKEVRRYHDTLDDEEELVHVKREHEEETGYAEIEEVEGDFEEFPSKVGKGKKRRSPTIGKGAGGGRGRGKKARLDDDDDFSDGQGADHDEEMNQEYRDEEDAASPSYPSPPSKPRKSTTTNSTKRGKRRPSTRSDSPVDRQGSSHSATPETRRAPLTEGQKRSNHILSEQKRRNAIRSGFKDLVDLLTAGETASAISIAPPLETVVEETTAGGKKKKAKGSGRGRGRKGEIGAGASKSVILEKASMYISWLRYGNEALEEEVKRVEALALGR